MSTELEPYSIEQRTAYRGIKFSPAKILASEFIKSLIYYYVGRPDSDSVDVGQNVEWKDPATGLGCAVA